MGFITAIVNWVYQAIQFFIAQLFSPDAPPPRDNLDGPRIAVIGAGITGVSSAAHCVGHGFDVTLFEAKRREHLGGIWSVSSSQCAIWSTSVLTYHDFLQQVNNTSSLQIHSIMYRFHPSVRFRRAYPDRQGIIREVTELWKRYRLDERTEFNVPVEHVWQDDKTGKWYIQDPSHGTFDGVIAAIGTCGDPKVPHIPGQEKFKGKIYHSSDLTGKDVKEKRMIVVGGGASAIEAAEFAVQNQTAQTTLLSRVGNCSFPQYEGTILTHGKVNEVDHPPQSYR